MFGGFGGSIIPRPGALDDYRWSEANKNGELIVPTTGSATVDIIPKTGFRVADVSVKGISLGPISVYTFLDLEDSMRLDVIFDNSGPTISPPVPDQINAEDAAPWVLDLKPYENDLEDDGVDLNWSVSGVDTTLFTVLATDIDNDVFTFTPVANAFGSDDITLTLRDSSGLIDTQVITVTLESQNDVPVVSDIPDQGIAQGNAFVAIALDDFVDDVDNVDEEMSWSFTGNVNLNVNIDADRLATIGVTNANWSGSEIIVFRATDPEGLSDADAATFTISVNNDPPTIKGKIPDQTRDEDAAPWVLDLTAYENDLEDNGVNLDWSVSGVDTYPGHRDGDRYRQRRHHVCAGCQCLWVG